jgi:hypothetical protein
MPSKGGPLVTSRFLSAVRRHPLVAFFVLTFAFSWAFEIPLVVFRDAITDAQGLVLIILASNVPSVLGIVLTAIVLGRGALRKLLGRLLIWRVDPRWYLVVLGPVALAGGAVALNALVGGPALSVILTWVYNGTGGSLLMVVLLHATFNLPMTLSLEALGSRAAVPLLLYWGLLVAAAIAVVVWAGPRHLSRRHTKQEQEGEAARVGATTPPGAVKPVSA